jgi:hypothetical protein
MPMSQLEDTSWLTRVQMPCPATTVEIALHNPTTTIGAGVHPIAEPGRNKSQLSISKAVRASVRTLDDPGRCGEDTRFGTLLLGGSVAGVVWLVGCAVGVSFLDGRPDGEKVTRCGVKVGSRRRWHRTSICSLQVGPRCPRSTSSHPLRLSRVWSAHVLVC